MTGRVITPPPGYSAAQESVVRFDQSHRTRLLVTGRAPGQMLSGVLTGTIPSDPGRRYYSTVLTPKGRMITDLFVIRLPGEDERFLLDVSPAGREALLDYFKRVLPPRFAKVTDASTTWKHHVVMGPQSAAALAQLLDERGVEGEAEFEALQSDGVLHFDIGGASVVVVRSPDSIPARFDVFVEEGGGSAEELLSHLLVAAVPNEGSDVAWSVLRVEAGTPEFGTDMVEKTIPIEAGIEGRAIDGTKGCYTGQEVIVRILHRGHVNRHLRTLRFAPTTEGLVRPGDELYVAGSEKAVGEVTSVVNSPVAAGPIALGYVRREVEVGQAVRVGGADGATAVVLERGPITAQ